MHSRPIGAPLRLHASSTIQAHARTGTEEYCFPTGTEEYCFLCSADHEQNWQPYPVDPYSAICDDHTYIHTYIHALSYSGYITRAVHADRRTHTRTNTHTFAQEVRRSGCTCRLLYTHTYTHSRAIGTPLGLHMPTTVHEHTYKGTPVGLHMPNAVHAHVNALTYDRYNARIAHAEYLARARTHTQVQ